MMSNPTKKSIKLFSEQPIWSVPGHYFESAWLRPGYYFAIDNKQMDAFRLELLKLQAWCSDFTNTMIDKELLKNWEILDATHHINDSVKGNFFIGQSLSFASAFMRDSAKYKLFKKSNVRNYQGLAMRHKESKLVAILTAGTKITSIDHIRADRKLFMQKLPNKFCIAGEIFVDFVRKKYLGNNYPHIFVGHSLGCAFNMWMNGIVAGNSYVLNIDAFCGSRILHQLGWMKFQTIKTIHTDNIDSIIGSDSFLNNYGKDHIGQRCQVNTQSNNWLTNIGYAALGCVGSVADEINKHIVANIALSYGAKCG